MDQLTVARVAAPMPRVSDTISSVLAGQAKKKAESAAEQAVDAKIGLAAKAAPAIGTAASLIDSAKKQDNLQFAADALKLSAETVAKKTAAAPSLGAGSEIINGLNKAAQGDAFGAASAASAAAEKLAPALAKSGVGALASAVVLGTGENQLAKQAKAVQTSVKKVVDEDASKSQRVRAAFDLTVASQNLAGLVRTLGLAAVNVGRYGVKALGKAEALAPAAAKLTAEAGRVVASPVGRAFTFLNKWIPLLNVAGVAISAKTLVDVYRAPESSARTKGLTIASLVSAGAGLWAGFALGGLAFLGIVGASIGLDLLVARSRKQDAQAAHAHQR